MRPATLLDSIPLLMVRLDGGGRVAEVNRRFEELTHWPRDEARGRDWFDTFVPERARERGRQMFRRAIQGKAAPGTIDPILARDGRELDIEWHNVSVSDEGVICAGLDVTERTRAEEARALRQWHLARVIENAPFCIHEIDLDGNLLSMNGTGLRMLGLKSEDSIRGRPYVDYVEEKDRTRVLSVIRDVMNGDRSEIEFETQDGKYYLTSVVPLSDRAGKTDRIMGITLEITERRRMEHRIAASLREKELLLREIHHRVKNNLQMVSSLMHFHAKKVRAPEDGAAFMDIRRRISAMTLVHERLYQSHDVARVDVGDYFRDLIAELRRSFERREGVRVDVAADDVRLPVELALPAGMIACELVTNVLKYAFPGAREGTAVVSVRAAAGRIVLAVDDDGVGFPKGFDPRTGGAFGWELVRTLVLQLDGEVEAAGGRGAHVRVSFPSPEGLRS